MFIAALRAVRGTAVRGAAVLQAVALMFIQYVVLMVVKLHVRQVLERSVRYSADNGTLFIALQVCSGIAVPIHG